MNVADLVRQLAAVAPQAEALVGAGGALSFAELDLRVERYAARLARAGIEPGRLVGIALDLGPENLVLALALARLGAVSVRLSLDRPPAFRALECRAFGVTTVIAGDPGHAVEGRECIRFDAGWAEPGAGPPQAGSFHRPRWPWRLHISSGTTTRELKGVLENHDSIVHQAVVHRATGLVAPGERFLAGLPMSVAAGMRACMRALLNGVPVVFPRSPRLPDIVEALRRHAITQAMLPRITLEGMLATLPRGELQFPGLRHLIVGGFPMPPALVEEIAARIAPDLYVFYGATEVGVIAMTDLAGLRRRPGSVGGAVPGIRIEIVDAQDRPLPPGEQGIVRVRGVALPDRYVKDPETTRKVFRGGWTYPGDYGRMDEGGCLYLEARLDDVVKLDKVAVNLARVDQALAEHPQVAAAAAYLVVTPAGEAQLHAAVVARGSLDEAALRAHCGERLTAAEVPLRLRAVAALPRNESGKVMRHALARQLGKEAVP